MPCKWWRVKTYVPCAPGAFTVLEKTRCFHKNLSIISPTSGIILKAGYSAPLSQLAPPPPPWKNDLQTTWMIVLHRESRREQQSNTVEKKTALNYDGCRTSRYKVCMCLWSPRDTLRGVQCGIYCPWYYYSKATYPPLPWHCSYYCALVWNPAVLFFLIRSLFDWLDNTYLYCFKHWYHEPLQ